LDRGCLLTITYRFLLQEHLPLLYIEISTVVYRRQLTFPFPFFTVALFYPYTWELGALHAFFVSP